MDAASKSVDEFVAFCKRHQLKVTPQRVAIFGYLADAKNHPTADEVHRVIREQFPGISFDTVNRTLQTFVRLGLLDEVEAFGGPRRFDPNMYSHHHLHCVACGSILDFDHAPYDEIPVPPELEREFHVTNKRVVLKGLCKRCQSEKSGDP